MKVMGYSIKLGDVSYKDLSRSSQTLAKIIGMQATLMLVDKYGGVNLRIPHKVTEDQELVRVLGMTAAESLSRHFGGDSIAMSKEIRLQSKLRNTALVKRRKAGASGAQLAKEFDLTLRSVWQILSDHK